MCLLKWAIFSPKNNHFPSFEFSNGKLLWNFDIQIFTKRYTSQWKHFYVLPTTDPCKMPNRPRPYLKILCAQMGYFFKKRLESLRKQIFAMEAKESLNIIFYLAHNTSLYNNIHSDHFYVSKQYVVKVWAVSGQKTSIFKTFTPQIFIIKSYKSIKIIFYSTKNITLIK